MEVSDRKLHFSTELWAYNGAGGWHFATLPAEVATQVRFFQTRQKGFGTVRVTATIGRTSWKTSLFPDKASNSYLLPVKADIRRKESLAVGDMLSVELRL